MTIEDDHRQQPTYKECHKEIMMEENAAYGHITHTTKNHQLVHDCPH